MAVLQMDRETLDALLEVSDITSVEFGEIIELFLEEKLPQVLPDGSFQVDPRNGDRIIYHASRSLRPHDNPPERTPGSETNCLICRGKTTGIVDVAELSEGFTFINKNLFPVLYPLERSEDAEAGAYGLHFLQWTSSFHDRDWHNMPVEDCAIVISRMAALEQKLVQDAPRGILVDDRLPGHEEGSGHVLIIKNYGRSVGASLSHGHQQVLFSNITPRRAIDHLAFESENGEVLTEMLLRETSPELIVNEYDGAILLVPDFMRRPYEMFLVVKDTRKRFLYELSDGEFASLGNGWHDATGIYHHIMPGFGKEIAYNVASFTGPGSGIYFEFLPYTQPMGGLERIGMYICQELPDRAAEGAREVLEHLDEPSEA
jgi:galactose-1-phosphate uridylyltransferase